MRYTWIQTEKTYALAQSGQGILINTKNKISMKILKDSTTHGLTILPMRGHADTGLPLYALRKGFGDPFRLSLSRLKLLLDSC